MDGDEIAVNECKPIIRAFLLSWKSPLDKDPNFVTALGRGLDILRCFTPEKQELGTTEIARMTGMAQSTVWRLCYTLSKYGCLTPGRSPDRLRVGAGVLLLGHAAVLHDGIAQAALPLLKQLADEFDASVSLAERHGTHMIIVQRSEAPNIVKVDLHIGSSLSIGQSSLGLAYLSAIDTETRAPLMKLLKAENPEYWDEIQKDITSAQSEYSTAGYVFNLGRSHKDINAVGVPVISPDGTHVMAITCGGVRSSMTRDKLAGKVAPALKVVASKIALMLGSPSAAPAQRR